jgi:hypothetical protein
MESAKARPTTPWAQSYKPLAIVVILLVLALIALGIGKAAPVRAVPAISQQTLAAQYGLRVNLIAVTAAGGMVDLRLQIVDVEKAKALLEEQANFPALRAPNGVVLRAGEDIAAQPIKFENGANLFVLYPNMSSAVKAGDVVPILFGDRQVEGIQSK